MQGKQGKSANFAYLDLIATALTDHEKNLHELIERLGKVTDRLSELTKLEPDEPAAKEETAHNEENLGTLMQAAKGILTGPNEE